MPRNQALSPEKDPLRAELRTTFEIGLMDVGEDKIEHLRSLSIFGGSPEALVSLPSFRRAFQDFVKKNDELLGALSEIAIRLFGAEEPYRQQTKTGREAAAGLVSWLGKINEPETVRRPGRGRRDRVLDRIAVAIVRAEEIAHKPPASNGKASGGSPTSSSSGALHPDASARSHLVVQQGGRPHRRIAASLSILTLVGIAAYLVVTLSAPSTSHANHRTGGYNPANRPVFLCIRQTNCLGPAYPIFNSYTNAPDYGDERDFLNARPVNSTRFANKLSVKSGQEVLLRLYYDNDAEPRTEAYPGSSTARGTRAAVLLPNARASTMNIAANITATNTRPRTISDTVTLYSKQPFDVIYVPYTARLVNRAYPTGLPLPSRLVTGDGTLIGYEKMDGNITGCFCQSGLITLRVLVE